MKARQFALNASYYALNVVLYAVFLNIVSLMLKATRGADDLGFVMAITYGVLFIMTPILVAVIMRFSLLKWYVDPIAAAEIPVFLYVVMIANQAKRSESLRGAFLLVNDNLGDDGGEGWLFLIGLFIFGLIASFSVARKSGKSISFRLLSKITHKHNIAQINNGSV